MGDEPRSNRALVDGGDRYGHVLETARQGMTISKIKRNTGSGGPAVDERISMNGSSIGEIKRNRNEKMV